jgi:hypothetical protein
MTKVEFAIFKVAISPSTLLIHSELFFRLSLFSLLIWLQKYQWLISPFSIQLQISKKIYLFRFFFIYFFTKSNDKNEMCVGWHVFLKGGFKDMLLELLVLKSTCSIFFYGYSWRTFDILEAIWKWKVFIWIHLAPLWICCGEFWSFVYAKCKITKSCLVFIPAWYSRSTPNGY